MKIVRLDHVQITIPEGAESAARIFYMDVLGLSEIEKPEALKPRGGFWLNAGDRQVHVGVESGVDRRNTKAHVAFEVIDLERAKAELSSIGIEIAESIPIPGLDRFEFRDPFGNRLELLQFRPAVP